MALRNKEFVLLSAIGAATVFGVSVFSASASEATTSEEEEAAPAFRGFRNRWLDTLTYDQLATLKEMIEKNRAEVKEQLEDWGAEISELDDEQRELLKTMMNENRAEVQAQLEEWGVEVPEAEGLQGFGGRGVIEFEPIQTMK
jgi:Spy/CpxP family protein refolding chaperone